MIRKNDINSHHRHRYTAPLLIVVLIVTVMIISIGILSPVFNIGYAAAKSKSPEMKPEHREFKSYAQYIFTKDERKIFRKLSTNEARDRFIENFWEIRDPTPFTGENEFKLEMERRYDFVSKYFKEGPIPGWKTDRGKIYLMLGAPTAQREDRLNRGGIIQWYYDEFNVYVRFNDNQGYGIYRLDVTTVSLALLDVLDNKKHFIVDEEGKIRQKKLNITLKYDSSTEEILIRVGPKNLNFERNPEDNTEMMAKLKVDLVMYPLDNTDDFSKFSEIKSVMIAEEKLLTKDAVIRLNIPLRLPKGKTKIDAIISDALGEALFRKFITLKINK